MKAWPPSLKSGSPTGLTHKKWNSTNSLLRVEEAVPNDVWRTVLRDIGRYVCETLPNLTCTLEADSKSLTIVWKDV